MTSPHHAEDPDRPDHADHPVQQVQLERAGFVISIDTEMSWGLVHRPSVPYLYDAERAHLTRLLDLFDQYSIPATWAVVGHLFLGECSPVDGRKHPEIVRPDYDWFEGDWFDADPCTDVRTDPTWYGPDVVEEITCRRTEHEIGSHGFSHMIADDPGCTARVWASELDASRAAAAAVGIELRSFIHPRNRIGHVPVLAEHGFRAFRGKRPAAELSGTAAITDRVRPSAASAVHPLRVDGMWSLPATCMYDVASRRRTWRLWVSQVERRLRHAVRHKGLFHLWFHPHNLRDAPEPAFAGLERLCAAAAEHRQRGELDTVTMGAVARDLDTRFPA
jgi:peptidoglycan/xylan/chitin deacetylase (PgdA/CDA1 family)